ncbi:MAG TPA: 1,4-alpha-glucan branching protein domain-containing protein [Solirubrobacteraceae bacterium]|nr:1,4-alpha-glucan branching protein domain-containing protein [Solirubrobacteraceae bacterium]
MSARGRADGALAIVLDTHMPYVEGFGTWPFGEEWLWEAMAGSYLPLLELLEAGAPLTLSLTPVLCDQLEAPGIFERFGTFVEEVRGRTHAQDIAGMRSGGHEELARELERSRSDYESALERLRGLGGDLLGALGRHAQWTSAATHAVLPLLATDALVHAQVRTGVESHRARVGGSWRGGFWLPECAHAPWLEAPLAEAGVRAVCVELTERFGLGAPEHLRALAGEAGVTLVPIDRATISLVWSDAGYPAHGDYRDYHRHTVHHHNPWCNGGETYDHARALRRAREHAADFVARTLSRLREARLARPHGEALPGGGLVVCALDTELLGHWWYEGVSWLEYVVEECAREGLELVRLDDALARHEPATLKAREGLVVCTWGRGGDLSTWSGAGVAEMAFATRAAELRTIANTGGLDGDALRELLALQSSDWAFMVSNDLAVPYARERFAGHLHALDRALAGEPEGAGIRNLAVHADPAMPLAP